MRINKYLSSAGIVSRRGADKWIEDGRITINGQPAELGSRVNEGDDRSCRRKTSENRRTTRLYCAQ